MLRLIIWIFWLILLWLLTGLLSKNVILTPQFGFIGCFIPQAIFAIFFVDIWELNFSDETMFVLLGGTAFFFLISELIQESCLKPRLQYYFSGEILKKCQCKIIEIRQWKIIIFIVFQLLVLCAVLFYFVKNVPGTTLLKKIAYYNVINKFSDSDDWIRLPRLLSWPRMICSCSAYVMVYVLLHSIILKYKQHRILLSISIVISILLYALNGGRFPIIALLIAAMVQAYFIYGKSKRWKNKLKLKTILISLAIFLLAILMFRSFGRLLGRTTTDTFVEYLVRYLSAPIKNLDTYIRKGEFGCDISNWQTLVNLVNLLGRKLNIPDWIHSYDQPFMTLNGKGMGNVYTVFYWYLHDGGYAAVFIFLTVLIITSQFFFIRAVKLKTNQKIDLNVIIYSYLYYAIVFSFFCERYFISLFDSTMVQMLLIWWLLKFYLTDIKINWGRK